VSGGAESSFWDYQDHEIGTVRMCVYVSLSLCACTGGKGGKKGVCTRACACASCIRDACERACTCIRTYNHTY
jgi:hypothetical protein